MRSNEQWHRVNKHRCCPICGKPDWCLYTGPADWPLAAICARTENAKPCGSAGWLHKLRDDPYWRADSLRRRVVKIVPPAAQQARDFAVFARECRQNMDRFGQEKLAASLGLSKESLERLQLGWAEAHRAWTFPMCDAAGKVVGIRLRLPDGRKLSVQGGREGLFLPEGLAAKDRILICEGPTDTAAMLDLGFAAIGRPGCSGAIKHACELITSLQPNEVVVVADADEPGQRGAENLATVLLVYCAAVRVIRPPGCFKDARAWKQSGVTSSDVQRVIDAAGVRRLRIATERQGGRDE